jgi:ABC-type lipoprotein release transport system permease subunit
MRLLRAWLYGVQPADPATLFGIVVALTGVVVVACWIPARRAASIPAAGPLRGG